MLPQLNQVRNLMEAAHEPIRYQPTAEIPAEERVRLIKSLQWNHERLLDAMQIPIYSQQDPNITKVNLEEVLRSLSCHLYLTLKVYHTLGISHTTVAAFSALINAIMSTRDPGGHLHPLSNGEGYIDKSKDGARPADYKQFLKPEMNLWQDTPPKNVLSK